MSDVVIRLERGEVEELLYWTKGKEGVCDPDGQGICVCCNARRQLRAALDSPPVEERVDYRAAGQGRERPETTAPLPTFKAAEDRAWQLANPDTRLIRPWTNVRVQSRTITTFSDGSSLIGPWTDLEGEGER